ncbi:Uncharacterized protein SCG7109_AR_00130 [Chlamydiales bacterium SCGC AG-110-M15]|nr:Uncharacterized protein SCG7109_AR_00130 [Chlamydiales bacterium SCGC AG-110-M15]
MLKKKIYAFLKRGYPKFDRVFNKPWHDQPFGSEPQASEDTYLKLFSNIKDEVLEQVSQYEKGCGFSIDRAWLQPLVLHTQVVIKKSPLCFQHGPLLYSALRSYIEKKAPNYVNIIETGTARGFSSLCLAKALQDADTEGKIMTFDVLPHKTAIFWNCIDDLQGPCTRESLLQGFHDLIDRYLIYIQGDTRVSMLKAQMSRIHFAFLDGAHTYKDLMNEFQYLKGKQQPGDIIVFDDYVESVFPGVVKAVDEICDRHAYQPRKFTSSEQRAYVIATKC